MRAYQRRGKSSNAFKVLMVPAGPWRGLLLPSSRVQSGKWLRAGAFPATIAVWVERPGGRPCQGVGVCCSSFFQFCQILPLVLVMGVGGA